MPASCCWPQAECRTRPSPDSWACRAQVARRRERYARSRLAGIERDLPRGAPPAKVDVARLVELTTQTKPKAATHWSTRTMAAELGVSAASISRHWRANGLKPHVVRGFEVSRDPQFIGKLEDIVGLYMSPPEHAPVSTTPRTNIPSCSPQHPIQAVHLDQKRSRYPGKGHSRQQPFKFQTECNTALARPLIQRCCVKSALQTSRRNLSCLVYFPQEKIRQLTIAN